jgi:predicted aspartyl protease
VKNLILVSLKSAIIILVFFISVQARDISPFVQIPFELKSGYIVFEIPIDPSGSVFFLFDTGCQTTTISKDVLAKGGRDPSITLLLGTRRLKIEEYHIRPRNPLSKATGQKIDGVIGNDLLHRYRVKIDYQKGLISLFDNQESITYPDGEELRIGVNSLVSSVPLSINFLGGQKVEGEFVIDTGAPINVLINSPVAEKNGLYTILDMSKDREFKTLAAVQTAAAVRTESVRIGKFECTDMEIYISTTSKGLFAVSKYAGIVGNKFFQNFNVIFDYKRQKLHLEKH